MSASGIKFGSSGFCGKIGPDFPNVFAVAAEFEALAVAVEMAGTAVGDAIGLGRDAFAVEFPYPGALDRRGSGLAPRGYCRKTFDGSRRCQGAAGSSHPDFLDQGGRKVTKVVREFGQQ